VAVSYNVAEGKTRLSEILERVEQTGEEIVLTRRGRPIARLVPERGGRARQLGFARGKLKLLPGWEDPVTFEDLFGESTSSPVR
jgi:prevent-host-death family protein